LWSGGFCGDPLRTRELTMKAFVRDALLWDVDGVDAASVDRDPFNTEAPSLRCLDSMEEKLTKFQTSLIKYGLVKFLAMEPFDTAREALGVFSTVVASYMRTIPHDLENDAVDDVVGTVITAARAGGYLAGGRFAELGALDDLTEVLQASSKSHLFVFGEALRESFGRQSATGLPSGAYPT
jgi:hypothetical protein